MPKVIRRETRKRGVFGWIFLLIFLGFNAFMALAMIRGLTSAADIPAVNDAERAGRTMGAIIGGGALLVIWFLGAAITGLLAMLTRGSKTVIEEIRHD